jgi:hypothetical protein
MCEGRADRSVGGMTTTLPNTRIYVALAAFVAAVLCAAALWPSAGEAAGRTKTIKAFSKITALTVTHPDGTVVDHPPFPEMQPGDVLDVYALDFRGNHKRHAKRFFGSEHLQCVFGTGEPDCVSHTAIGSSLMIFAGNPGKLIAGTGRFAGATGRAISNKEVPGGNDIVVKVKLAKHHR